MHLLSLIGEQPIPNLLAARALQPKSTSLCYSATTRRFAANLADMLPHTRLYPVDPYDLERAAAQIGDLCTPQTIVNLTGGTKTMALAAYEVARSRQLPFVYLQSEGAAAVLQHYKFENSRPVQISRQQLGSLITIGDYLLVHGLRPIIEKGAQNAQETGLRDWLSGQVDELRSNLVFEAFEVDLILRRGSLVAVLEAKMKVKNDRSGIDQLNTITGRDYLGTYTGKILAVSKALGPQLSRLAEARHIQVVVVAGEIDSRYDRMRISKSSRAQLQRALIQTLGPTSG